MSGFIRVGGVQKLQDEEFIVQVCESYRHFSFSGYILKFLSSCICFTLSLDVSNVQCFLGN